MIHEMELAAWADKGTFTRSDAISAAYLFSRELEHSDINIARLEHLLKDHQALGLKQILCCIS